MSQALATRPTLRLTTTRAVSDARSDVGRARNQLLDGLDSMRRDLHVAIDWRAVARRHPVAAALAAAGLGLLVAQLFLRRR